MIGKCLLWVVVFCFTQSNISALTNSSVISNLKSRMHTLPNGGSLIKSFSDHSQSYIYDQSLAIITFSRHGDKKTAGKLLLGLKNLQNSDGSLYFSYYLNGKSPYPIEGDKRFAGAIAWVALSAATYQKIFHTTEFLSFNNQLLTYLSSQIRTVSIKGNQIKALAFAPNDILETSWNENEVAALEHNLDAYSAFSQFAKINKVKKYEEIARELKDFAIALWDESRSHFWSGVNLKTGAINKSELYLDNQSWSMLALDKETVQTLKIKTALEMNCEQFLMEDKEIKGFMDRKPTNRPSEEKYVWSEGSAGQILAMKKYHLLQNERPYCLGVNQEKLTDEIKKMVTNDGGIAYATIKNSDFTTSSSVAGTAWYYFIANSINPFNPEDQLSIE